MESERYAELKRPSNLAETALQTRASASSSDAVEALQQTLDRFQSRLAQVERPAEAETAEREPLDRTEHKALEEVDEALVDLVGAARRLADDATALADELDRLQAHLGELPPPLVAQEKAAPAVRPVEAEPPPEQIEPKFDLADEPLSVVIAGVPGFQGLMDVQRAMDALPNVVSAAVVGYRNGEASLEAVLRAPVAASEIADGLRDATGHQLIIEESRPDALRLRLRFIEGEGGLAGGSLRTGLRRESPPIG